MSRNNHPISADDPPAEPDWIAIVREKVSSLRYGLVQITVHEGRITQLERTERTRIDPLPAR